MAIFIPTYGTITALELAQSFISHVFSKHGLPVSIVSDRGSLFVSSFWTQSCQQLKISRDLSTAFHPETDGQTDRVNQILGQYLCIYVSYHQDDWYTWLPLAEFAYNNAEDSSTKQSPFSPFMEEIPALAQSIFLKTHLLESYQQNSNQYTSNNIKKTRTTKKLSEKWLGPFEVLKKIGSHAYHLKFPQQWKTVHPVFHVSLLEPVKDSTIPNCHQLPPPPVLVEEKEEWEVAEVLD
ncbi:hypothetical protein O181_091912 [Austropuccinia psidii MF-1]|uniref:Integrase catalytic domain-containing protein n=1 Tax=Austropuccinia psidii MF-1 TaxID=1389203 RepID=A0A9Q3IYG6_9BASI|nr:hypothetical protein [Austropuccinia psidii MF-1]